MKKISGLAPGLHPVIKHKNQSNAWNAWRWRKYMWLAIHDGAITLGVSLHEDVTKLISVSQRQDAAAGTQTAEPLVILTACLFSFAVGGHESDHQVPATYHCRWKILLILRNLNKKQGINTKKNTVLRGKTRHPSRNLARKICLICN